MYAGVISTNHIRSQRVRSEKLIRDGHLIDNESRTYVRSTAQIRGEGAAS